MKQKKAFVQLAARKSKKKDKALLLAHSFFFLFEAGCWLWQY